MWEARQPSGRAADSRARGRGSILTQVAVFVLEQNTLSSKKVLVIPRKRWLCPDMTKNVYWDVNQNRNKTKHKTLDNGKPEDQSNWSYKRSPDYWSSILTKTMKKFFQSNQGSYLIQTKSTIYVVEDTAITL